MKLFDADNAFIDTYGDALINEYLPKENKILSEVKKKKIKKQRANPSIYVDSKLTKAQKQQFGLLPNTSFDKPAEAPSKSLTADISFAKADLAPANTGESGFIEALTFIKEDIEKHDTLNKKLFDLETNKLKPEVIDKINEIVDKVIDFVKKMMYKLK